MIKRFWATLKSLDVRVIVRSRYFAALGSGYSLMLTSAIIQLLLVPVYLAVLGDYQFGLLIVLLSFVNLAMLGIAWMSGGSLRMLGQHAAMQQIDDFSRSHRAIKAIYASYGLLTAIVLLLITFFGADFLFIGAAPEDLNPARWSIVLTGVYITLFYTVAVDRIALTACMRQSAANFSQVAAVITAGTTALLFLHLGAGMPSVIVANILGALVGAAITQYYLRRELPGKSILWGQVPDRVLLKTLGGKTGFGFFVHGVLMLLLVGDAAIIGVLGGAIIAGQFYLVWKGGEVLVLLFGKIAETFAPYFVHMDVRGQQVGLSVLAKRCYLLIASLSAVGGILYGFYGSSLVGVWVGVENVPDEPVAFILAGGAVFWLSIARLPIVLAGAQVKLLEMNLIGILELGVKWLVAYLAFSQLGFFGLFLGVNVAHIGGVAWLYVRLMSKK